MLSEEKDFSRTLDIVLKTILFFLIIPLIYWTMQWNLKILAIVGANVVFIAALLFGHKHKWKTRKVSHALIIFLFVTYAVMASLSSNNALFMIWYCMIPLYAYLLLPTKHAFLYAVSSFLMMHAVNYIYTPDTPGLLIYRLSIFHLIMMLVLHFFSRSRSQAWKQADMTYHQLQDIAIDKARALEHNYTDMISSLVQLLETRDAYTAGHSERVAYYACEIAKKMNISNEDMAKLHTAGLLHDIGKVVTPDNILLKPGRLGIQEYQVIQEHCQVGYDLLSNVPMYEEIANIILHHHERYDGSGYPNGLTGEETPLLAQILSVADTFDAMTTNRIYKPRKTRKEACEELKKIAGTQLNPDIVAVATKILVDLSPGSVKPQLDIKALEKGRFSYFYKDRLTECFNSDYLRYLVQFEPKYKDEIVVICELNNMSEYNNLFGWREGNKLIAECASELRELFPQHHIVRFHGDNFAIFRDIGVDLHEVQPISLKALSDTVVKPKYYMSTIDGVI